MLLCTFSTANKLQISAGLQIRQSLIQNYQLIFGGRMPCRCVTAGQCLLGLLKPRWV